MSKPLDDEPPDTEPVSNALDQELGRALDREEARRLEERILTDEELRAAAARKTVVPSSKAKDEARARETESTPAAPGKNLFGGTVRGLPAQPQRLDAEGSVPASWAGARSGKAPQQEPIETPAADTSISEPIEAASAPEPRRPASPAVAPTVSKPQNRRFLYLAALLVVVPVTILLIARAIDPKPVFSAKPSGATETADSRPVSGNAALPSATTDPATTASAPPVALPPIGAVATVESTATTVAIIPVTPSRAFPPDKTAPMPTAVPSTTPSSPTGVEPFFKRAQP